MIEPTRRAVLATTAGALLMAADKDQLAWAFQFPAIEGGTLDLKTFKGRVLLVANTASFCGYTYQYEGLQKLHATKSPAGLTVIGVPSRDFNKILIGRDGRIAGTFGSGDEPDGPALTRAIDTELARTV